MEMESLNLRPLKGICACSFFCLIFYKGVFFFFFPFLPPLPLPRDICILLKHFSVRNSLNEANCAMCSQLVGRTSANSVKVENSWGIKDEMGFIYFPLPLLTKLQCTLAQSIGVKTPTEATAVRYIPLYPMHQLF